MKEHFDHRLSNHIRLKLRDHEEPYELGAWESFNKNRKKKRKRLLLFYGSVAASISLIILSTFLLQPIAEHHTSMSSEETKRQASFAMDSTETEKPFLKDTLTRTSQEILANNYSKVKKEKATGNERLSSITTQNRQIIKRLVEFNNQDDFQGDSIAPFTAEVKPLHRIDYTDSFMIVAHPEFITKDILPTTQQSPDSIISSLAWWETDEPETEERDQTMQYGLIFNNSLNQLNAESASGSGSNTEIGLVSQLSLSKRFQVSSGMILAKYDLERIEELPTNLSGQLRNTQTDNFSAVNVDIPMSVAYALPLPKNKSFITSIGISNLVQLNTRIDTENEIEREVLLIQLIDGVETTSTVIETSVAESSSVNDQVNFIPASSINLSIGYEAPISDHFSLRLAPFYRYPINQFLGEQNRFFVIGLHTSIHLKK